MKLSDDERVAVVTFRIQKAKETFMEARGIAGLGYWNAVVNRLYYACYYITSALLIKNQFAAQTHRGVIHLFALHFIKTGKVSHDLGKFYTKLFELRQTGDYDDLYSLNETEVKPMIMMSEIFINEISKLLTGE